jgi:hypothetical protein
MWEIMLQGHILSTFEGAMVHYGLGPSLSLSLSLSL